MTPRIYEEVVDLIASGPTPAPVSHRNNPVGQGFHPLPI